MGFGVIESHPPSVPYHYNPTLGLEARPAGEGKVEFQSVCGQKSRVGGGTEGILAASGPFLMCQARQGRWGGLTSALPNQRPGSTLHPFSRDTLGQVAGIGFLGKCKPISVGRENLFLEIISTSVQDVREPGHPPDPVDCTYLSFPPLTQ